jgi:hypothetical protein
MTTNIMELNIRLDAADLPDSKTAIKRRESKVIAELKRHGDVAHRRMVNGRLLTLVAQVQAGDIPHEVLTRLAEDLHQDCIAVYYPQRDQGVLIGPRADLWVRFRIFSFERFEPALSVHRKMTQPERIEYLACTLASLEASCTAAGRTVEVVESENDGDYIATIPQGRRPKSMTDHVKTIENQRKAKLGHAATIMVEWGYETHELTLTPEQWSSVMAGQWLGVEGPGYFYEGKHFSDSWSFDGGYQGGLVVSYGNDGAEGVSCRLCDAVITEFVP